MKKFEVPYNFDEDLIKFYIKHTSYINFLYLPPFKEDLINTRSSIQSSSKGQCYMPATREEYEGHLKLIVRAGLRFVVLWQSRDNIISRNLLEYYTNLGAIGFTIANDDNAKIIKEYNPELIVICSLVQKLQHNIRNRDFSLYDYLILYYPFNRSLDALQELMELKNKIVLMPNTMCHIECPSFHHWFPQNINGFQPQIECWVKEKTLDKSGFIFPEHLFLFDRFVSGYKLQGREYPTEAIKYLCHFYFKREYYRDFINPFLNNIMAEKLFKLAHDKNVEEYYNIYSPKLIPFL